MSLEQLEFAEALKDSPRFRWSLSQHETFLLLVETKIKEVLRHCNQVIEFGKCYVNSFQSMLESMKDLNGSCLKTDTNVYTSVDVITEAFSEINKFQKILIEQAQSSMVKKLNEFIRQELSKVYEMRSHFQRVSQSLDDALVRNAQIPKHKEQEGFEARNELTAVGTCFAHTALDYVFQVNLFQSQQKFKILDSLGGYLLACQVYFRQGHELLGTSFDDTKYDLMPIVADLQQRSRNLERKMQDRHMLVPKEIFQHPPGMPTDVDVVMEGYLFKRGSSAFKVWNRRWFVIRDSKLLYCHRDREGHPSDKSSTTEDGYTVMEPDLRLCLVRPAPNNDRRNTFELVTPTKIHVLQADSDSLCNAWIKALQRSIESALHDSSEHALLNDAYQSNSTSSTSGDTTAPSSTSVISGSTSSTTTKSVKLLDHVLAIAGNELCADCRAPEPKWASVNLGITLCIECCAIHRSMGVQVSKVRSLTLDAWEPEQVRLMELLGNKIVNGVYLAYLPEELIVPPPAKPNSSRPIREAWIKAKYLNRQFLRPPNIEALKMRSNVVNNNSNRRKKSSQQQLFVVPKSIQYKRRTTRAMSTAGDVRAPVRPVRLLSVKNFCSSPSIPQMLNANGVVPTFDASSSGDAKSSSKAEQQRGRLSSYGSDSVLVDSKTGDDVSNEAILESQKEEDAMAQNQLLLKSSKEGDLKTMCLALARGASVNYSCRENNNLTSLHEAVKSGSLEACEFLLLNGAKVNVQDVKGRSPLHLACQLGHTAQVCQLLKRGASQEMSTVAGETALDISMASPNADIVTLLRLAKLNEEIKESDLTNHGEELFAEVVRDFSFIASNHPENLRRNHNGPSESSV